MTIDYSNIDQFSENKCYKMSEFTTIESRLVLFILQDEKLIQLLLFQNINFVTLR